MITMLLGGLWHGASWNFVLWGGFHGVLLVVQHWWMRTRGIVSSRRAASTRTTLVTIVQRLLTFALILIGWTLFRCESGSKIIATLTRMFAAPMEDSRWLAFAAPILTALAIMLLMDLWRERQQSELTLLRVPMLVRMTLYSFFVFSVVAVGFRPTQFIYFQF